MDNSGVLDGIVLVILVGAAARGLLIGVIREAFSLGALVAACVAIRYATAPVANWLAAISGDRIPEAILPWIAGALVAVLAVAVVGTLGRLLRRGARAVGLGFVDRALGAVLGAAEGALVALLVILGAIWLGGRDHAWVAQSMSLRAYDGLQAYLDDAPTEVSEEIRKALQEAGSTHAP